MRSSRVNFHHPFAFWVGCIMVTAGVLAHMPMFIRSAPMGFHMAGMTMGPLMWAGMGLIFAGVLLAAYGVVPRGLSLHGAGASPVYFRVSNLLPLNREHWVLVSVLVSAVAIDVMKPALIGFVMPGMAAEYQISGSTVGHLALSALTGTAIGSVLCGLAADWIGRRAVILVSAVMFCGTAICGAMPSFTWNLVMCFLMGASAGGLLPITFALMAEVIPAHHRGWLLVTLGGVGTAAGYLLAAGSAAILEPLFSWRILWMLNLPTGLLLILVNRYIPESPRYLARIGAGDQARTILVRFCRGRDAAIRQVVADTSPRADRPGWLRRYLGVTAGLAIAGLVWGVVNFGFVLWLPTHLEQLGGMMDANLLLTWSAVWALPGILVAVWLYHHWSSIHTLTLFIVVTATALAAFVPLTVFGVRSPVAWTAAVAALLIGSNGVIAMLVPYAAEIYPESIRATGAGVVAATSKTGGILGAALGVAGLFSHMAVAACVITAPLLVAGLLLWRYGVDTRGLSLEEIPGRLDRRHKRSAAPELRVEGVVRGTAAPPK